MAYLLIVDDDEDLADAVAMALRKKGHEVVCELDPGRVLGRIEAREPDLVILDVMFPEDDIKGFTLARSIRGRWAQLPILMLTAINQKFPLGFGSQDIDPDWLPVADFLEKPVDFEVLNRKISGLVSRRAGK